jgi:hypothetical protein
MARLHPAFLHQTATEYILAGSAYAAVFLFYVAENKARCRALFSFYSLCVLIVVLR